MSKIPTDVTNDTQVANYVQDVLIHPEAYTSDPVKDATGSHIGKIYAFSIFGTIDTGQVRNIRPFGLSTAGDIYLKKPDMAQLWHNAVQCSTDAQIVISKFHWGSGSKPNVSPITQWVSGDIHGCDTSGGTTTPQRVLNPEVVIECEISDTKGVTREIKFRLARS